MPTLASPPEPTWGGSWCLLLRHPKGKKDLGALLSFFLFRADFTGNPHKGSGAPAFSGLRGEHLLGAPGA